MIACGLLLSFARATCGASAPSPPESLPASPNPGTAAVNQLYQDLYTRAEGDRITFGNLKLQLTFDATTGDWLSFAAVGLPGSLLQPTRPTPAADARVNGAWLVEMRGAVLLRSEASVSADRKSGALRLVLGIPASRGAGPPFTHELAVNYTLYPGEARLDRAARLLRLPSPNASETPTVERLEEFRFTLPGVAPGDPADCVVDVPGPWFPTNFVAPDTPYAAMTGKNIGFHGAPDGGFGFVSLRNTKRDVTLAAWMDTGGGETNYSIFLYPEGERLALAFTDRRAYRMAPGFAAESDTQRTELVAGPLENALHQYRAMAEATMPLDPHTPDWARDITLLEVFPNYYKGGFKEITERLPHYRDIGFNTIYLMPHWTGGYSPLDLYEVDPRFGSADDLKAMVATAHRLGMRVLFDMVIHGFNEKSPIPKQRPDLFIHDEAGNIIKHPTWGSLSTDWASPAYQQYMADLAVHDTQTYGIDGYRVDAASYKGPGWDPNSPSPAYRSGAASAELLVKMIAAMRKVNPNAVLLSEVFGPVFYTASNLGHDNQTEAVQQWVEKMERGEVNAAQYRDHMANVYDLLPRGANRVFFARNHDTSWFYHFNGYSPRFMAMDAIHALCAIPEVFAGDPDNGPNPDDDPATWAYYRKLFMARKEFPELAHGERLFRAVACDNPMVFTALRRLNGHQSLVVVSLSDKAETATLTLAGSAALAQAAKEKRAIPLRDLIHDGAVNADPLEAEGLRVTLAPYQVLAGRL